MPNYTDCINSFNDLSTYLIPKIYLPAIRNVAFLRKRSWLINRIPRSSKDIDGLKVYITYETKLPWAWRSMTEFGFTPTGSKFGSNEMYAQLGCHAAAAIVSLFELVATSGNEVRWARLIERQMNALATTFPYYLKGVLWSSNGANKALGKAVSIAGTVVTLDNAGLWNTSTTDRAKLFEPGMFVQTYRSTAKVGTPVEITAVNKTTGTITLASDPGVADNDVFVSSDIAGLDVPYGTECPGILDVIDDDNTFQGINRSTGTNSMFRAVIKSASGLTLNHKTLTDFFHDVYDPDFACTNWQVIRKYWEDNLQDNRRFTAADKGFVDDFNFVQVGKTKLVEDDDMDCDKIIVPDFGNMRIADKGDFENLFGKGWQQVAGRPFLEYLVAAWLLLMADDTRYMGELTDISLA